MSLKSILKLSSLFIFLFLFVLILKSASPYVDNYSKFIDTYIVNLGTYELILLTICGGLLTGIGLPRQIIAFSAGYAFGVNIGTVLATFGACIGGVLAFLYARFAIQEYIERRYTKQVVKINSILQKSPILMIFFIRLMPGNNFLTCLICGVSRISFKQFFIGTSIGYIPQNFIFALLGSGIKIDGQARTLVSLALFIFCSCLGIHIYKKITKEN